MTIPTTNFIQAVEARRSYYNLTNTSTLSDAQLQELVEEAIKYTPSSFNSQTSRAVLVLGDKHRQLWDAVWAAHSPYLTNEAEKAGYQDKFENAYKSGYGTVLFFEDQDAVDLFVKNTPVVAGVIDAWKNTTSGMAQFIVWTGLAANGVGASLQHYPQFSPANQAAVVKFLGIPEAWHCTAMMPFGVPADINAPGAPAYPKTFQPIEDRVKVVA